MNVPVTHATSAPPVMIMLMVTHVHACQALQDCVVIKVCMPLFKFELYLQIVDIHQITIKLWQLFKYVPRVTKDFVQPVDVRNLITKKMNQKIPLY